MVACEAAACHYPFGSFQKVFDGASACGPDSAANVALIIAVDAQQRLSFAYFQIPFDLVWNETPMCESCQWSARDSNGSNQPEYSWRPGVWQHRRKPCLEAWLLRAGHGGASISSAIVQIGSGSGVLRFVQQLLQLAFGPSLAADIAGRISELLPCVDGPCGE